MQVRNSSEGEKSFAFDQVGPLPLPPSARCHTRMLAAELQVYGGKPSSGLHPLILFRYIAQPCTGVRARCTAGGRVRRCGSASGGGSAAGFQCHRVCLWPGRPSSPSGVRVDEEQQGCWAAADGAAEICAICSAMRPYGACHRRWVLRQCKCHKLPDLTWPYR